MVKWEMSVVLTRARFLRSQARPELSRSDGSRGRVCLAVADDIQGKQDMQWFRRRFRTVATLAFLCLLACSMTACASEFLGSEYGPSDGTATLEALAAFSLPTENREEALRSFVQTAAADRGHDVSSELSDYLLVHLARLVEPDSRDRAANAIANTLLLLELMIAESGESRVLTMEHLDSAIVRFRLCPGFWPFC